LRLPPAASRSATASGSNTRPDRPTQRILASGTLTPTNVVECAATGAPNGTAGGDNKEACVDLSMDNRTDGDRMVVDVGGEIDVYTAPKLRERLVELINSGHYHLIVNLEGVDFLDSTGLGVLVGALKRVRAHEGSLLLVCTQERLLKIFRITGLAKVFPIYESVEAAAKA
jgi:anti-sigma B factor antagonist